MARKRTPRVRHIPQRTCIGCRTVAPKRSLIRIVQGADGLIIDPTGKLPGRGAYLHERRSCWEQSLKGSLFKALKIVRTPEIEARLRKSMEDLPEETEEHAGTA